MQELAVAYIGDLFGPRLWAEHDVARNFAGNLLTALPRIPEAALAVVPEAAGTPSKPPPPFPLAVVPEAGRTR